MKAFQYLLTEERPTVKALSEAVAALHEEAQEIVTKAEKGGRSLTAAETEAFNARFNMAGTLRTRLKEARELEKKAAAGAMALDGGFSGYAPHARAAMQLYRTGATGVMTRAINTTTGVGSIDTDVLQPEYIEYLQKNMGAAKLGARIDGGPDSKKWPKQTGLPEVTWPAAEGTALGDDSGLTIGAVQRNYRTLATKVVKAAVEWMDDANGLGEQLVEDAIVKALMNEIETRLLNGDGTNHPRGLLTTPGVNYVSAGGALSSFSKLIDGVKRVMFDNVTPDRIGIYHSVESFAQLAALQDLQDNPMMMPQLISSMPYQVSTAVGNDKIYLGDWTQAIIGLAGPVTLKLVERYADNLQVGFIAYARVDYHFLRPNNFSVITGITPAAPTT